MSEEKTYSIVAVSEILNLAQSTIRKYEEDYNIRISRNELGRREYKQLDIDVLKNIQEMKREGHNIHTIRKALNKNPEAMEQKDKSLEITNVDEMTGAELFQLLKKSFEESMSCYQEQQKKEFEIMREEIRLELHNEFESQADQNRAENQKLMDYLQKARDEKEQTKGLFSKLFKK
jgi:DNA-binding transcriptional MerR regulator